MIFLQKCVFFLYRFENRFFPDLSKDRDKDGPGGGGGGSVAASEGDSESSNSGSYILGKNWRDLIPVIKVDLSSAKFVFGNKLLPTTLVLSLEEAHCTYSTKPAGCQLDHFMHFLKCKVENFKVLLAPSPKYTGMRDEAPRYVRVRERLGARELPTGRLFSLSDSWVKDSWSCPVKKLTAITIWMRQG